MNLQNQLLHDKLLHQTRRQFITKCSTGLGAAFMSSSAWQERLSCCCSHEDQMSEAMQGVTHFAPKAKRVIFLHMAGAPSNLDLFDYKPELTKLDGKPTP